MHRPFSSTSTFFVFRNRCPHAKTLRRIEPCAEMFQHRAFEDFASPRNNAPTPSPSAMGHRDALRADLPYRRA